MIYEKVRQAAEELIPPDDRLSISYFIYRGLIEDGIWAGLEFRDEPIKELIAKWRAENCPGTLSECLNELEKLIMD